MRHFLLTILAVIIGGIITPYIRLPIDYEIHEIRYEAAFDQCVVLQTQIEMATTPADRNTANAIAWKRCSDQTKIMDPR